MRTALATVPTRALTSRRPWHLALIALLLAGAFSFAVGALTPSVAQAADLTVNQCNGQGPGAMGATTRMTCSVTVVNTIKGKKTSSTTTVTRHCSLGPCAHGNGTFVTHSTDLVTSVRQCNGADPGPAIMGCTAIINARSSTPAQRSAALTNRGPPDRLPNR